MDAYAVIKTGGKQYRVQAGDTLEVEKLDADVGTSIALDAVLALSDGNALTVGTPMVEKVKVASTVVDQIQGPKVVNFKKKRRKGYTRKVGHRQALTVLKIDSIG